MNRITYPLTLLCDRRCAICRLEMDELRALDDFGRLRFEDISAPGFDAAPWGATPAELDARIHAVDASGRLHRGVPVLRMAYASVGKGWVTAATGWPLLRSLFDAIYRAFARHRHGISRVAAPLIDRISAFRLSAGGKCEGGNPSPTERSGP